MNPFRLRPRFHHVAPQSPEQVRAQLFAAVDAMPEEARYRLKQFHDQLEFKIPRQQRHTWSPQLVLLLAPEPSGATRLSGRFGPMEQIWTMFMALYGAQGCLLLAGLLFWFSERALQREGIGLWLSLAAASGLALTHLASLSGQSLGQAQMDELSRFILHTLAQQEREAHVVTTR